VFEDIRQAGALSGVRVLVTRPREQAEHLSQLIEREGGTAVRFPAVEITEPSDPTSLPRAVERLDEFDLAIFISPNAVHRAMPAILTRAGGIPKKLIFVCVGRGSAHALKTFGIEHPIAPTGSFDSEALLNLPELQRVAGTHIVIFRGEGGRALLGQTLKQRGAHVEYAECYRRRRPTADPTVLRNLLDKSVEIISVTSIEVLQNLLAMVDAEAQSWLFKTPIVVLSQRQASACREAGFLTKAIIAREASDEAVLEAIKTWRASQKSL